jgi:hypothetical protein
MKKAATHPHFVVVRYAELVSAVLKLNVGYNDEILTSNLKRLRAEIEKLLSRSLSALPSTKQQVVFLLNNYHLIIRAITSKGIESEETQHFRGQASEQLHVFVDEELTEKFPKLSDFCKTLDKTEAKAGEQKTDEPAAAEAKLSEAVLDDIAKHFVKSWKDNMEQIYHSVLKNFCLSDGDEQDQRLCSEILKAVLIQLVQRYHRFLGYLDKAYARKRPAFMKDLVSTQTIMYEIKKYASERLKTSSNTVRNLTDFLARSEQH